MPRHAHQDPNILRLNRLGIDTYREPVIYMTADCPVCRSEGWTAEARIQLSYNGRSIIATLNVVTGSLLTPEEVDLSEIGWQMLGARDGDLVSLEHPPPLESLSHIRAKVFGHRLSDSAIKSVVSDIVDGRYSAIELAAFVTAFAGGRLDLDELVALTRAMTSTGERLYWGHAPIVDKHCVGGLPGNRTTMIIVPIVAAYGLTMPKTSSRAITSPAGTADTMETVAPVTLDVSAIRRVVEREGACIVWGGAVQLSPADDVIISVERPLDLDSHEQMVASILSKKLAPDRRTWCSTCRSVRRRRYGPSRQRTRSSACFAPWERPLGCKSASREPMAANRWAAASGRRSKRGTCCPFCAESRRRQQICATARSRLPAK